MSGRARVSALESHVGDAQLEDVLFLVSDGGCSLAEACARVGVSVDFVEMRMRRAVADSRGKS